MKALFAILALLLALPSQAGTWGLGQFDNDEAMDRALDWSKAGSVADIRSALEAVQRATYVESSEAMTALAEAEVVAAASGRPSPDMPDALGAWIARQPAAELTALAPLARSAISKVVSPRNSELRELWADEDLPAWLAAVAELSDRIEASPSDNARR